MAEHVDSKKTYYAIFAALLALTYVTVAVSGYDFGRFNLWIALGIAVFKASLVLLFFMHLKYDRPFNAIVIIVSMALVILLIAITLTDTKQYEPQRIPGYAPSIKTNPQ